MSETHYAITILNPETGAEMAMVVIHVAGPARWELRLPVHQNLHFALDATGKVDVKGDDDFCDFDDVGSLIATTTDKKSRPVKLNGRKVAALSGPDPKGTGKLGP